MKTMSLRNSRAGGSYYRLLERTFVPLIKRLDLGPNAITFLGFLVALLVPAGFLIHIMAGFALMLLSGMIDTLDGMTSRTLGNSTRFGAFWDSTLDRFSDALFLLGFWVVLWKSDGDLLLGGMLFSLAVLLTLLISYTKARMEALGSRCSAGLMSREVRIVYLLIWALFLGVFSHARLELLWVGLTLYLVLVGATVLQRIHHAWTHLDKGRVD
jgi:CDP-diacylglycerol---glycerol-3-phosphate 3-phosphatidyltransferase